MLVLPLGGAAFCSGAAPAEDESTSNQASNRERMIGPPAQCFRRRLARRYWALGQSFHGRWSWRILPEGEEGGDGPGYGFGSEENRMGRAGPGRRDPAGELAPEAASASSARGRAVGRRVRADHPQ